MTDSPPFGEPGGRGTMQGNGTGKEAIDLGWTVTATMGTSSTAIATADFRTSGIDEVRELSPRRDDWVGGSAPGCVLPYFKTTWTLDTNLYLAVNDSSGPSGTHPCAPGA
ncbi:hypothetical protein ACIQAC_40550 [Streptomyces sp. NPDC088387]|uniref:hypothetical protein n=1 Tax=Streptomyces sp. NPDC088387 TaxID=3365859 RepID=UPI0038071974